jgi:hypothetical protein
MLVILKYGIDLSCRCNDFLSKMEDNPAESSDVRFAAAARKAMLKEHGNLHMCMKLLVEFFNIEPILAAGQEEIRNREELRKFRRFALSRLLQVCVSCSAVPL